LSLSSTLLTFSSIFVTKCLGVNDNATIIHYTHFHMYMYLNWFAFVGISYDANNVVYNQNRLFSSTQILKHSTYLRTLMECEVSYKYSKSLVTFSKSWCSIPIVITFSGMLISVSSIVAPFLSSDGHTCNSRRWTDIRNMTCTKLRGTNT